MIRTHAITKSLCCKQCVFIVEVKAFPKTKDRNHRTNHKIERLHKESERWLISSNSRERARLNKMDHVKAHELTKYNFVKFMIRQVQTSTYKLDPAVKSGNKLSGYNLI